MSDAFRDFFAREDRVDNILADLERREFVLRAELARIEKERDKKRCIDELWERERIDTMYVAWIRDNAPDAPRRVSIVCPKCRTTGTVDGTDPTMSLLKCSCGCIFPLYPFQDDTRPHIQRDPREWTWTRTDSGYVCMPPTGLQSLSGTGWPYWMMRDGWNPGTRARTSSNIIS